jgi:hypothetical protein
VGSAARNWPGFSARRRRGWSWRRLPGRRSGRPDHHRADILPKPRPRQSGFVRTGRYLVRRRLSGLRREAPSYPGPSDESGRHAPRWRPGLRREQPAIGRSHPRGISGAAHPGPGRTHATPPPGPHAVASGRVHVESTRAGKTVDIHSQFDFGFLGPVK